MPEQRWLGPSGVKKKKGKDIVRGSHVISVRGIACLELLHALHASNMKKCPLLFLSLVRELPLGWGVAQKSWKPDFINKVQLNQRGAGRGVSGCMADGLTLRSHCSEDGTVEAFVQAFSPLTPLLPVV